MLNNIRTNPILDNRLFKSTGIAIFFLSYQELTVFIAFYFFSFRQFCFYLLLQIWTHNFLPGYPFSVLPFFYQLFLNFFLNLYWNWLVSTYFDVKDLTSSLFLLIYFMTIWIFYSSALYARIFIVEPTFLNWLASCDFFNASYFYCPNYLFLIFF